MATAMPHACSAPDVITLSTEIQSVNTNQPNRINSGLPLPMNEPLHGKNPENQSDYDENETNKLRKLIKDDLQFIDDAYKNLEKYKAEVKKQLGDAEKLLQGDIDTQNTEFKRFSDKQLFELKKHIMKLKTEIPSKVKVRYSDLTATDAKRKDKPLSQLIMSQKKEQLTEVPSFYKKEKFKSSEIFKEFEASFKLLKLQHKLCLLCFSVFPENAIIKRRLLMYWWIGEGFILSGEKPEDAADKILNELVSKSFIEPVYDKCPFKRKAHSYKLQPLARAAVNMLAEKEKFFDFDDKGDPVKEHNCSLRSCLLKEKSETKDFASSDDKNNSETKNCFPFLARKSGNTQTSSDKPMAHVVFNLSKNVLQLKPQWFAQMKHVNIFYLGRLDSTSKHHIEMENAKDLEGLADLKYVRFLSLREVSGITEIPDSIYKLWNLSVLDLRGCLNLEVIPQGIGSLHSLTHLDISECYLLTRMPKDLSKLINLVVLKGFEVQDTIDKQSCTLEDLTKMEKLYKLSIHTEMEEFPRSADLAVLQKFRQLRILTIEWGGNMFRSEPKMPVPNPGKLAIARTLTRLITRTAEEEIALPPTGYPLLLDKLDLKCYPKRRAPTWLKPNNLQKLKKLYIRGGELRDLGQLGHWGDNPGGETGSEIKWKVETLRLKYLIELEMDWTELQELFPELKYLEKVKCPKFTMFPCNAHGVWMNKKGTF